MTKQAWLKNKIQKFVLLFYLTTTTALFALSLWSTPVEAAGEPTKVNIPPWAQFGEVTIHPTSPEKPDSGWVRFVIFENWDALVELHEPSSIKKLLQLVSPSVSLYYGLTEEEIARHPFAFYDYILAPVLGPLLDAFPDGIDQVPYEETPFTATWDKRPFHGLVIRTSSDAVRYDITMNEIGGGRSIRLHGTWQRLKKSPLPDDFSLQGWQLQRSPSGIETNSVRTLGELRKKRELPKHSQSSERP